MEHPPRQVFVKHDPAPLEAAGLRWLADAGARVPAVLAEAPGRLVLERIEPGALNAAGEEELGRMLAVMHAASAPRFGSLPASTWVEGEHLAHSAGGCSATPPTPRAQRSTSPATRVEGEHLAHSADGCSATPPTPRAQRSTSPATRVEGEHLAHSADGCSATPPTPRAQRSTSPATRVEGEHLAHSADGCSATPPTPRAQRSTSPATRVEGEHLAHSADGRFFVGRCELASPEADDWNTYYLEHRLMPLASRVGLESLAKRIRVDAPAEPPARLHGDLWTGNVLADRSGRPWLIDPAAYGGHREMDLAMLDLFGRVPERTRAAYQEIAPLADGWRERIGLWQLFPLLVHAVLFGGHYLGQSAALARRLS